MISETQRHRGHEKRSSAHRPCYTNEEQRCAFHVSFKTEGLLLTRRTADYGYIRVDPRCRGRCLVLASAGARVARARPRGGGGGPACRRQFGGVAGVRRRGGRSDRRLHRPRPGGPVAWWVHGAAGM